MTGGPRKHAGAGAPDGAPRPGTRDEERKRRSNLAEVQDPLIAGDTGKRSRRLDASGATVDEAGQIRRKDDEIDLLH